MPDDVIGRRRHHGEIPQYALVGEYHDNLIVAPDTFVARP